MTVNSTSGCILGLLQMGPAPGQPGFRRGGAMTGGQLYAAASRSVARFWNLTRSQIYAELPRLRDAGLISADGDPGARGAQPYHITAAGRDEFDRWIHEMAARGPQDDQLRSPMLLSVFFGHFLEPQRLRHLLEEYRARHQRALALAEEMLAALGPDRSLPGAALVRRRAYERLTVDWLEDTIGRVPVTSQTRSRPRAPVL